MSIAIGSLNLASLSTALTERIPISGPGDPGVLLSTLGFAINKVTRVAVDYGSATNQASVIAAAITAASAGDCLVFGAGVVKIETQITVAKKLIIKGNGTIFRTTSNIALLVLSSSSANESVIEGIQFEGNNTGAGQKGLVVSTVAGFRIDKCNFKNFAVAGYEQTGSSSSPYATGHVTNCDAVSCTGIGFNLLQTSEYTNFTTCGAYGCGTGWKLAGGNMTFSGCNGTACTTGLLVDTATNNGHSTVQGGHFNHNGTNINVNDLDGNIGIVFVGVQCFTGTLIVNTDRVCFTACQISVTTITISNCNRVLFLGCFVHGTPTVNGTSTANAVWQNCYADAGTAFTG